MNKIKSKISNCWEKVNLSKKLSTELRRILGKVVNKEELSEEEIEFIRYLSRSDKK